MIARRTLLFAGWAARYGFSQTPAGELLRGKLVQSGKTPVLSTPDGRTVSLESDEPTGKILRDTRLNGKVFEAKGHRSGGGAFAIDPIETRPMVAVEGAKRLRVTYYCDVCSIRTYSPGPCMCCQAETRLDLIDPAAKD